MRDEPSRAPSPFRRLIRRYPGRMSTRQAEVAAIGPVGPNGCVGPLGGPDAPVRPRGRAAHAAVVGAGVAAFLFLAGFVVFLASLEHAERDPAGASDAIVALTGGAQRIEDAVELLAKGFGNRLLITGVNERTSREEIARLTPGQRDLVECCVDLDYRAQNTVGNAVEIGRWARSNRFHSLIVVTSNYHMPRALAELERTLPHTRKIPHAVIVSGETAGWFASPTRFRLLFSEYVKYLAVLAKTRLALGMRGIVPAAAEPTSASSIAAAPLARPKRAASLPKG